MDGNKPVCVYLSAPSSDDIWKRLPAISGSGAHGPHLLGHNQEEEAAVNSSSLPGVCVLMGSRIGVSMC